MIECGLDIPWSLGETCIWILCSRVHLLLICVELCVHFLVLHGIVGVNENVIKIYDYRNVKHVSKNIVYEVLECYRSVGESKGMTHHSKES